MRPQEDEMRFFEKWRGDLEDARARAAERGAQWVRAARPERERPSGWLWLGVAALGAAVGGLLTFLLDPDRGRSRRARYADQLAAGARRAAFQLGRGSRLAAGRLAGAAEELKHAGDGQPMPNDPALTSKVETELFRDPSIPKGRININTEQGVVVLRGEVDNADQSREIERRARRIPGVVEVENLLHLPKQPARAESTRRRPDVTLAGPGETTGDGPGRLPS
jgi:hypothetical protein